MNKIQYRRWKDFAIRMANRGWSPRTVMQKEYQRSVVPAVHDFFSLFEGNHTPRDRIRISAWDQTESDYRNKDQYGHAFIGPYVCDLVADLLNDYNPFHYADEEYQKAYEGWDERWGGYIQCCLRAGLDLACEPSAGVWGMTKADFERMYPEGVPGWMSGLWGKRNGDWKPTEWSNMPSDTVLNTGWM